MLSNLTPLKHWQTFFDITQTLVHAVILFLAGYGLHSLVVS